MLHAGDCVLQPPEIRHRVLESSPRLEVVEIGCPAEHETHADHSLALPTAILDPQRDFSGQRFVRHVASEARWTASRTPGFEYRDLGIAAATDGLAGGVVKRAVATARSELAAHAGEFLFTFVLVGSAAFERDGEQVQPLAAGDAYVMPAGQRHALTARADGFELLEVALPAR